MGWVDRTYFIVRRRYRAAGIVGSVAAVAITAFHYVPNVQGAEAALTMAPATDMLTAAVLLLLAGTVPSLLASLGWRLHRRRYFLDA